MFRVSANSLVSVSSVHCISAVRTLRTTSNESSVGSTPLMALPGCRSRRILLTRKPFRTLLKWCLYPLWLMWRNMRSNYEQQRHHTRHGVPTPPSAQMGTAAITPPSAQAGSRAHSSPSPHATEFAQKMAAFSSQSVTPPPVLTEYSTSVTPHEARAALEARDPLEVHCCCVIERAESAEMAWAVRTARAGGRVVVVRAVIPGWPIKMEAAERARARRVCALIGV